ncbi:MAG TPA: DUF6531 domain-containing protein, partial [Bacteroidales bacterium]|nr:DUF6531 domain-containing protein [Bacteroidales bacterium]
MITEVESESPSFVLQATGGPNSPYETAGGTNLSENCVQNCHGDPVNTATGEFWEANDDLVIPQNGPMLGFVRNYTTSKKDQDGGLGYGWTNNYNMKLRPTSISDSVPVGETLANAGQIAIVQENGSESVFTKLSNGTYVPPARVKATLTQDVNGDYTFIRNKRDTFVFGSNGILKTIKDKNDNILNLTYGENANLVKVANMRNQYLNISWENGRIDSVSDHTARTVSYDYDSSGNLISTTNPGGATRNYTYDGQHRVLTLSNELGGITTNNYYGDSDNRIASQTDPRNHTMSFFYYPNQTLIMYPDGYQVAELYNKSKQLTQKTEYYNGKSSTYNYQYSPDGFVSEISDPQQRLSYMSYNENGNVTAVQDNAGNITRMTYDETGNLLTTTNSLGDTATMTYDNNGNMTSSISYEGRKTVYHLNSDGTPNSIVSPKGNIDGTNIADYTSSFTYTNGYLNAIIDANNNKNNIITDSLGRLVKTVSTKGNVDGADPDDYSSYITYDSMGNILETKDSQNNKNINTYDAGGNVLTSKDPMGRISTFTYDNMGNLLTSKDPLSRTTSYEYDSRNRLIKITNSKGKTSEIT